jgi:hypothetical protein
MVELRMITLVAAGPIAAKFQTDAACESSIRTGKPHIPGIAGCIRSRNECDPVFAMTKIGIKGSWNEMNGKRTTTDARPAENDLPCVAGSDGDTPGFPRKPIGRTKNEIRALIRDHCQRLLRRIEQGRGTVTAWAPSPAGSRR